MKPVYILQMSLMNGTVTLDTIVEVFATKELAEECLRVITKKNEDSGVKIRYSLTNGTLYETREDCEILQEPT